MLEHAELYGPHWDADLIGADGRLKRLHKGASPQPVQRTPPPVRETARDVQQAKKDEREAAAGRKGYNQSLQGGEKLGTLFGGARPLDKTGATTLFGL